jgi:endoglucanase
MNTFKKAFALIACSIRSLMPAACLLVVGVADASAAPPPGSPLALHGRLKVCGTMLCDKYNRPVQLRGMSSQGLQWFAQCINDKSLTALQQDWKSDVIRLSLYVQEGGYETNPSGFTALMHSLIDKATARGLYVIVDWHILNPGDPYYNLTRAKTFFADIASRYKNQGNIIYETANEPHGVSWDRIRAYHELIIPVIRSRDPQAVILLGTRGWSSLGVAEGANETEIINNPVRAKNVMYTFHFYAASHRDDWLATLSRTATKIPVFVSEFGTQTYTGSGANDFVMSQKYMDAMKQAKVGWTNWNFSDYTSTGAVLTPGTCPDGPYTGTTNLKESGVWVRDHIREPH